MANFWTGSATVTNGIATFYQTDDGTKTGNPTVAKIISVQACAVNDTTMPIQYPFCAIKKISDDRTTVTVNVGIGVALGALGNTIANAPDGTQVYLTIHGSF